MTRRITVATACLLGTLAGSFTVGARPAAAQRGAAADASLVDYQVLATNKTSTMEQEMNGAAGTGYRYSAVMGGETSFGGAEVVVVMARQGASKARFQYKLLATTKTSTMQRELQEAADVGFAYAGQTVFKSTFGGREVVCILERDRDAAVVKYEYKLLATKRTSTMQKELADVGVQGFEVVGMTVGDTSVGGAELVTITRRSLGQGPNGQSAR